MLFYLMIGVISLLMGSVLNMLIYRLPVMLNQYWKNECELLLKVEYTPCEKINLFFPRSFCPTCKTMIPIWHNIPLISYILCRGKCFSCQCTIPVRYFIVELLSGLLGICAAIHFGYSVQLLFSLCFIWILIAIFFIDFQHQLIPDELSLSLLWIGLLANTHEYFAPLIDCIYGAIAGYLSLWLVMQAYYLITKKIGMGHGDFKLFAAFGAWFGWTSLPLVLFASSLLGAVIGLIYLSLSRQSKETPIAFGPFLCILGFITLFFKDMIPLIYYALI